MKLSTIDLNKPKLLKYKFYLFPDILSVICFSDELLDLHICSLLRS